MALEAKLARHIKDFLDQATITREGATPPDEIAQEALLHAITDALTEAIYEGRRVATGEQRQIAAISALSNLAGRAVAIVGGIIDQLVEKARNIIDDIFGSGEVEDVDAALEEVQSELGNWAADYSDMVATTEIHAAVEEAVMDEAVKQGATQIYWNAEPDACLRCLENEAASPIPIGGDFPSADTVPPAHPRCRCTSSTNAP